MGQEKIRQFNAERLGNWLSENKDWIDSHVQRDISLGEVKSLCLNLIRKKDKRFQESTKESLLHSVIEYFNSDLNIDWDECYFVPSYNKDISSYEVELRPSYRGLIKLAERIPKIQKIEYDVVRDDDIFEHGKTENGIKFRHKPGGQNEIQVPTGDVVAAYAFARLTEGGILDYEIMSKSQLEKARDQAETDYVWSDWFGEQAKKSVVKRFLKPFDKSQSPQLKTEIDRDNRSNKSLPDESSDKNIVGGSARDKLELAATSGDNQTPEPSGASEPEPPAPDTPNSGASNEQSADQRNDEMVDATEEDLTPSRPPATRLMEVLTGEDFSESQTRLIADYCAYSRQGTRWGGADESTREAVAEQFESAQNVKMSVGKSLYGALKKVLEENGSNIDRVAESQGYEEMLKLADQYHDYLPNSEKAAE